MPFPLVVGAVMAGSALAHAGLSWYSQSKQRDLYRYQKGAYERYYANWQRNFPGKKMRYPELNAPGKIRALDTGISQSYASSLDTGARLAGQFATGYGYARSSGLFGKVPSRTSRWL